MNIAIQTAVGLPCPQEGKQVGAIAGPSKTTSRTPRDNGDNKRPPRAAQGRRHIHTGGLFVPIDKQVCVLNQWEVTAWNEEGERPDCRNHKHISKLRACEDTGFGDLRLLPNKKPVEIWVGPRHILMKTTFELRIVDPSGFPHLQVLQQGHKPTRYRMKDLKKKLNVRRVEYDNPRLQVRGAVLYFPS